MSSEMPVSATQKDSSKSKIHFGNRFQADRGALADCSGSARITDSERVLATVNLDYAV